MARGRERHDEQVAALSALGKGLSRRARSRCELCGETGALTVVEVPPTGDEPSEDTAIFLCDRCKSLATAKKLVPDELHFLETAAWSEVAPVQLTAVRLLRRLAAQDVRWAVDFLDGLWLSEEITERLDA